MPLSNYGTSKKTIKISIAENDLKAFKDSNFCLCFAKKVNKNKANIIWHSVPFFNTNNIFEYFPQYKVFGSVRFENDVKILESTNSVPIEEGQTCVIDTYGIVGSVKNEGAANAISIDNRNNTIYPCLTQAFVGQDGKLSDLPVFILPSRVVGIIELQMTDTLLIWFKQEAQAGAVFDSSQGTYYEINLSSESKIALRFENGRWFKENLTDC